MLQSLLGIGIAVLGMTLLFEGPWLLALPCLVLGIAIFNGVEHGAWISFHFESSEDHGGDGGGDGGGGD